jgi:hypothetical protein
MTFCFCLRPCHQYCFAHNPSYQNWTRCELSPLTTRASSDAHHQHSMSITNNTYQADLQQAQIKRNIQVKQLCKDSTAQLLKWQGIHSPHSGTCYIPFSLDFLILIIPAWLTMSSRLYHLSFSVPCLFVWKVASAIWYHKSELSQFFE